MVFRKDLLEEFQCPICTEYMFPPISECLRGHASCAKCSKRLSECPECRSLIVYKANSVLEQLHAKLDFPCKYSEFGCLFHGKPEKLEYHESECGYSKNADLSLWKELPTDTARLLSVLCVVLCYCIFEIYSSISKQKNGSELIFDSVMGKITQERHV